MALVGSRCLSLLLSLVWPKSDHLSLGQAFAHAAAVFLASWRSLSAPPAGLSLGPTRRDDRFRQGARSDSKPQPTTSFAPESVIRTWTGYQIWVA
jgi:hypothetical protein